jgi:hypothetical protein
MPPGPTRANARHIRPDSTTGSARPFVAGLDHLSLLSFESPRLRPVGPYNPPIDRFAYHRGLYRAWHITAPTDFKPLSSGTRSEQPVATDPVVHGNTHSACWALFTTLPPLRHSFLHQCSFRYLDMLFFRPSAINKSISHNCYLFTGDQPLSYLVRAPTL